MVFRIRYQKFGAHVHCALFAAKSPNMTYAKCGDFVVREEEFESVKLAMSGVEFLEAGS